MATLVIWGGDDHKVRAEALATTYATTAQNVTVKPAKIADLQSLVFWGHGDPSHFCHLTSDEFVALVASWKKLNSKLDTVEMLTCNARHKNGAYTDSFTEQVVKKLTTKHTGIRFKALPVLTNKKGVTCEWSILKWHPTSKTWAYIGAPTNTGGSTSQMDAVMHSGVKLLEDFMVPRGACEGYFLVYAAMNQSRGLTIASPYATKRKLDQSKVDDYNKEAKATKENTFIMAGTLSSLRWWLTDIK